MQRHGRAPPPDITELSLDNKALPNPMETLSALHASQMRLACHIYRIRDDPERWTYFQRYLELLPQHALPTRMDYVQPHQL